MKIFKLCVYFNFILFNFLFACGCTNKSQKGRDEILNSKSDYTDECRLVFKNEGKEKLSEVKLIVDNFVSRGGTLISGGTAIHAFAQFHISDNAIVKWSTPDNEIHMHKLDLSSIIKPYFDGSIVFIFNGSQPPNVLIENGN